MNKQHNRTRTVGRTFLLFLLCVLSWALGVSLVACNRATDLTDLVSEYRNNLFLYEDETLSVKAHNLQREYPYVADGYKSEMNCRVELFVTTTKEVQHCEIHFFVGDAWHGGEASYDGVKHQFYFLHYLLFPFITSTFDNLHYKFFHLLHRQYDHANPVSFL